MNKKMINPLLQSIVNNLAKETVSADNINSCTVYGCFRDINCWNDTITCICDTDERIYIVDNPSRWNDTITCICDTSPHDELASIAE